MSRQREIMERRVEQLYQDEIARAEAQYQEGKARAEANRQRRLEGIDLFLPLLDGNGDADQVEIVEPAESAQVSDVAQQQKPSLRELIEPIVDEMDGDITQPAVYSALAAKHPEVAEKTEKTNISKILKYLVREGRIKQIKEAHATNPAVYRRVRAR